jgi:hypothetical protein
MVSTVVLIATALMAAPPPVNPAKEGRSVEETLKYINERLYISPDYSDKKCRDRTQLSLSDDRGEMIVKEVLIDRNDRIKDGVAPKYIYHVPIAAVLNIYTSGKWTTKDRVVVRTDGRAVTKYGPVWDCQHGKLNDTPKKRFLDSVDLRVQDADEGYVSGVAKAINHVVELLQAELKAKPASQQGEIHDSDKSDSVPDHK